MYGDSKHQITKLEGEFELHRFTNGGGTPYSAIYQNGNEILSCERYKEQGMLKYFNENRFLYES